jgi:hypothetical protein
MKLLAEARTAGLTVHVSNDLLVIEGPKRFQSLAQELLAQKPAVLKALQDECRRQYQDLTADIATTEDCEAVRWLTENGHEGLLGELLALDNHCAALARVGAPEAAFRAAVEAFANRVREIRELYRQLRKDPL